MDAAYYPINLSEGKKLKGLKEENYAKAKKSRVKYTSKLPLYNFSVFLVFLRVSHRSV